MRPWKFHIQHIEPLRHVRKVVGRMFASSDPQIPKAVLELLNCRRLPARLPADLVAAFLNIHPDNISLLVRKGMLVPLGKPRPNAPKFFAAVDVEERMANRDWMHRATLLTEARVRTKNDRQRKNSCAEHSN